MLLLEATGSSTIKNVLIGICFRIDCIENCYASKVEIAINNDVENIFRFDPLKYEGL